MRSRRKKLLLFSYLNGVGDNVLWTPAQASPFIWHESDSVSGSGSTSQWDDLSGNDRHSTQSAPANEPITGVSTLNGLNVLDFNGDFLSLNSDVYPLLGGDYTMIVLAKTNNTASSQALINFSTTATVGSLRYDGGQSTIEFSSGSFTGLEREGVTKDQFNIFIARRSGTTLGLSVNGDTETTNTTATDATPTNANIGTFSDGTARNLNGSMAAVLIYDTSLSPDVIDLNVAYLANKWGISI